jgi:hypothetical protein
MTQIDASQKEEGMKRLGLGGMRKVQFYADHFREHGDDQREAAEWHRLPDCPLFPFSVLDWTRS